MCLHGSAASAHDAGPELKPGSISGLPFVLSLFYTGNMDKVAPDQLAQAILSAPAWVRLGIAAPGERLRMEAALELARTIIGKDRPEDRDQLCLKL